MVIAYLGNFTQAHCTEVHIALTLEGLGHTVYRLQENALTPTELGNTLSQLNFGLFLFTRTWGETLTMDHLASLSARGIPSASYHLDLYVGLSRKYLHNNKSLGEMLESDPFWRTDFVFTPDGDLESQAVFEKHGVKHHYIKPGVFKLECYLAAKPKEYKHEVLFVGGGNKVGSPDGYGHPEWPYRDKLITWLYDTYGDRFTKFGHPQKTIRNDELNQLYADSKVVVGDSVCLKDFKHTHYWSDRVYETIGRGGFLIHPYIEGLYEEFEEAKTLVTYTYDNFNELKEKVDYYLAHDKERETIRLAGQEFVKNNATYNDRMIQMLDIINNAGAVPTPAPALSSPTKINLGAGDDCLEGYYNTDMLELPDIDLVHNLMDMPYPFESNSATNIKAIDVIEHLDHYTDDKRPTIMAFIEECGRILKVGGELYIQTPSWDSELFKIDPTHVRGFHIKSFDFFDPDTWYGKIRGFYGGTNFKVTAEELENKNLRFTMVKL